MKNIEETTFDEIQEIIRNLKRMKTSRTDYINDELLQAAGPQMTQKIQDLILKAERMPNEWNTSIICPIYKKGEKSECSNYREISLLNAAYKILATVINNRLKQQKQKTCSVKNSMGLRERGQLRITYL